MSSIPSTRTPFTPARSRACSKRSTEPAIGQPRVRASGGTCSRPIQTLAIDSDSTGHDLRGRRRGTLQEHHRRSVLGPLACGAPEQRADTGHRPHERSDPLRRLPRWLHEIGRRRRELAGRRVRPSAAREGPRGMVDGRVASIANDRNPPLSLADARDLEISRATLGRYASDRTRKGQPRSKDCPKFVSSCY